MFHEAIKAAAEAAPHEVATVALIPGLELHVDGDYLAYYASGNDDTAAGEARLNAIGLIDKFRSMSGAERVVVHNTAKGCHKGERYLVATIKPYQAQRKAGRKPKNHEYLQDWLQGYEGDLFRSKTWTSREADDGIAACAHFAIGKAPGYVVIATADKDLRMLPGMHINWQTKQLIRVNPGDYDVLGEDGKQYGLKFFFQQLLMGDTADHIPGLPEFRSTDAKGNLKYKLLGEKTAQALLDDCPDTKSAVEQVCDLYFLSYHRDALNCMSRRNVEFTQWADRLAEQAALLWMRCGLEGSLVDFAAHNGHSHVAWPQPIITAAMRLQERVSLARAKINELGSSDDPLCSTDCTTE